jgi:alpha/beta superfamily hydrolase
MTINPIIHEQLRIGREGRLSALLSYPADTPPVRAVLLCSPHPNFAGDMNNNVISALANALSVDSVVLRFDYRGVGESRIDLPAGVSALDHWDDIEQQRSYRDPLDDAKDAINALWRITEGLPIIAAGYSFGAFIASMISVSDPRCAAVVCVAPPLTRIDFTFVSDLHKPLLLVRGQDDFVYDPQAAARLVAVCPQRPLLVEISKTDHFFREREASLVDCVIGFVQHLSQQELSHDDVVTL